MKAIGNKILVKVEKDKEPAEKAGVFVVPQGNTTHTTAKVLSVGEEIKSDLAEGDIVFIYKAAGTEIEVEGEKYKVISLSDILVKKD